MIEKLSQAKQILSKYNQEHLLHFYDDLDDEHKEILINQILHTDFDKIITLYKNSFYNDLNNVDVSPLNHFEKDKFSKSELDNYIKIGENAITSGSVAVVTMAGGQGTRLGCKGPKGAYELDFEEIGIKKSLFQIVCEDLKRTNDKYNVIIPWFVMTSRENNLQTKEYFLEHNFWDYPKDNVIFFEQSELPLIDLNGKLILNETYSVKTVSNGNGNVFKSMKKHGIIDNLEKSDVKWISFSGIDNILMKNVDPVFIGLTISKGLQIASKSLFKKEPLEKTAVYCKKNGKISILDYDDINLELSNSKFDNGMYMYREANLLSHLMSIDTVKKASEISLKYHRAFKKNIFINDEGMKQVPEKPNSYKFENFIFDAFGIFDDMLLLRVNENEEFAPIKDFTGIYNPDTAKEKYEKFWNLI